MSILTGFLLGFLTCVAMLIVATLARRRHRRARFSQKSPGTGGETSRESVGETVVAVLNSGTRNKRVIRDPWWRKVLR